MTETPAPDTRPAGSTTGTARLIQTLNIVLLVAAAAVVGFLFGRNLERNRQGVEARTGTAGQSLSQRAAAAAPGAAPMGDGGERAQLPPDHPPVSGAMADGMAPIVALRERLDKNPNDVEALIELGNLNYDIGRFEPSVEYYQRAIAIDPTNVDAITDMGLAYRSLGRFDEALQAFDMAAAADATHWQSRLNRAIVLLMDRGDAAASLAAFEEYLALGPATPHYDEVARQVEQLRKDVAMRGAPGATAPAAPHTDVHGATE